MFAGVVTICFTVAMASSVTVAYLTEHGCARSSPSLASALAAVAAGDAAAAVYDAPLLVYLVPCEFIGLRALPPVFQRPDHAFGLPGEYAREPN